MHIVRYFHISFNFFDFENSIRLPLKFYQTYNIKQLYLPKKTNKMDTHLIIIKILHDQNTILNRKYLNINFPLVIKYYHIKC